MIIKFDKKFKKQYDKLQAKEKDRVDKALNLFKENTTHKKLRNHTLKGKRKEERAISAGGDLRLIFKEYEIYTLVLFLDVGSHNQVY